MTTLDAVLTRDSNGHHGVSVGDADGDGLEDLYVAQPAGLPNRLFRARGDGTFEDVTDRAGVGVLDDTAQSLFADVDNDGDQDLVLATGTQPLLFTNDGQGRFTPVAGRLPLRRAAAGRPHRPVDGRLRSRRLPRRLSLRLFLLLRRRRGESRHADAVPRRAQRPAGRAVPQRRARAASSTPPRPRGSTPATIATTSPRRGPTTTRTAGPTCSSPTTSASRTCIATSARAAARSASRTSRRRPASSTTAPA